MRDKLKGVLIGAAAIAALAVGGAAIAGASGGGDDGSQVDVHLDRGFNVINAQRDGEGSGENEGNDKD